MIFIKTIELFSVEKGSFFVTKIEDGSYFDKNEVNMNKIICINPPKFIKAILKLFARKDKKSD